MARDGDDGMRIAPAERARSTARGRSLALADVASRQHGVIAARQLLDLGFSRSAIDRLVRGGRLHRLHAGVYAVGHRGVTPVGRRLAAVLSAGAYAVASHTTAGALWDLRGATNRVAHVSVPAASSGARSTAAVCVHRPRRLEPADITSRDGIPVTTVARTLIDLGDVVRAEQVRRAFIRAEQLRLLDLVQIDGALERAGPRRGAAVLRGVLRAYDPRWQATRSGLELRMLDIVRDHGLPQPEVNAWIAGRWEADLLWPAARLVVEVDGGVVHGTVGARGRDVVRDRALRRLGYGVLHVAEADLDAGDRIARRIRAALVRSRSPR